MQRLLVQWGGGRGAVGVVGGRAGLLYGGGRPDPTRPDPARPGWCAISPGRGWGTKDGYNKWTKWLHRTVSQTSC